MIVDDALLPRVVSMGLRVWNYISRWLVCLLVLGCYQLVEIIVSCYFSIHILLHYKFYNTSFKCHILINFAGDGYYRFKVTLVLLLTFYNKWIFFLVFSP